MSLFKKLLHRTFMQVHGHPSYKWVQDLPYALRTIFKNYYLLQGSSCHLTISRASNGFHDICKGIKVIIKGSKSSLSHQGPLIQQMWVQRLLHQARGIMGFFNHLSHARGPLWVKIHYDITCGVARPSFRVPWPYHDIIIAWMTTEWVINASLTHLGFLQHPSKLQDHFQVPQCLQQDSGFKIQACGYRDLVNWVQGASRQKPTL